VTPLVAGRVPDDLVLIALGANLPSRFGKPEQALTESVRLLALRGLVVVAASRIWLTSPVPVSDQPWYRNAVVAVEGQQKHTPSDVLTILLETEEAMGRVRTQRNAPRIIDLDLLAWGSLIVETPHLSLPHPRLHERTFVLRPLTDIAPKWTHPQTGETLSSMIKSLPEGNEAIPDEASWFPEGLLFL
jgi:2-amino-4-hydroxy-6-hydroxymethyldihydropteridine diphosphokinase